MYRFIFGPMYHSILQLGAQLQDSIGEQCLYALPVFAAVLAVYFLILFRRGRSGP